MTTFEQPTGVRLEVVCDPCKREGFGHGLECGCNVVTFPVPAPAETAVDAPDAFTVRQEERDRIARANGEMGDLCRRWSTCGHSDCGWTSPEMDYYWQVDRWEADHECWGCNHRAPEDPIDVDLNLWPYPPPHPFTHRMEPLQPTVHVYRPTSEGYASTRTPQARRAA